MMDQDVAEQPTEVPDERLERWLAGRGFEDWRTQFERDGYLLFNSVLSRQELTDIRDALTPWLQRNVSGRNDFEGLKSNRVYGLLAKSPVFGDLVTHPLALAFAEADLGESCLLSACLAINLQPGESTQPWHHDDAHIGVDLPHPSWGVSAFWAIDETTETNGATEIVPGSHRWNGEAFEGALKPEDFANRKLRDARIDPGARPDAVKATMPAGSLMLTKGTLWHRGGANTSDHPRLIITPQYCPGWARQLENIMAQVPRETAASYPRRVQELIGYSIHPPFMGYVDGVHPAKLLG